MQKKIAILIIVIIIPLCGAFGQNFKDENRVFILDITGSMWGVGGTENIFDEVKESLIESINSIDNPATNITVITFGKDIKDKWSEKATLEGKNHLITKINTISYDKKDPAPIQQATNICKALKEANSEIRANLFNYLFLYTDGKHNYPDADLNCVRDLVKEICAKNNRTNDVYPFYIMLTKQADSPELRHTLKCFTTPDPGCTSPQIIIIRPERTHYSINLTDDKLAARINFISNTNSTLPSKVKISAKLTYDNYFRLAETEYLLSPELGSIEIELIPLRDINSIRTDPSLPSSLELFFNNTEYSTIVEKCKTVETRPNKIIIELINTREKTVTISVIEKKK